MNDAGRNQIRAIIFDLGGVLVRTIDYSPREIMAQRLGIPRQALEEMIFSAESGMQAQRGEIDADQHWENIRIYFELDPSELPAFRDAFWSGDFLDEDLVDAIRKLRRTYRTALLSNAFSDLRRWITEEWKIADAFDEIIISAEVGMVKPDRRVFEKIVDLLGVSPSQAVFIDDFPANIAGARASGMHAIQFRSPQQALADLNDILEHHQE